MATFFEAADRFGEWLDKRGGTRAELIVGYYKRGSQRPSIYSYEQRKIAAREHACVTRPS